MRASFKEILRYPEICPPQAGNFELFEALECGFALIFGIETALMSGYGLSGFGTWVPESSLGTQDTNHTLRLTWA